MVYLSLCLSDSPFARAPPTPHSGTPSFATMLARVRTFVDPTIYAITCSRIVPPKRAWSVSFDETRHAPMLRLSPSPAHACKQYETPHTSCRHFQETIVGKAHESEGSSVSEWLACAGCFSLLFHRLHLSATEPVRAYLLA